MKRKFLLLGTFLLFFSSFAQKKAFKKGEWLKYKLSYSGFLKAGEAEFKLKKTTLNGKKVYHAVGKGKTSSVVGLFFKVKDNYQSYFDAEEITPYKFHRDVYEGGYEIKRKIIFKNEKAYITDYKTKRNSTKKAPNVQDMISAFYKLRNYDTTGMKKGHEIKMNVFFDGESFPFKLKYLGDKILTTSLGKIKTHVFRPLVPSSRVFKEQESVKIWVSADQNKIPVFIKADLKVGSVRAELTNYKGTIKRIKTL